VEAFEQLCRVALESENFVVTGNVKVFVQRPTRKVKYEEAQEHGYDLDLVGARGDRLVVAEVKSYLGSRGVSRQFFEGIADETKRTVYNRCRLFNDEELRQEVVARVAERYGYATSRVEMRMYVGRFASGHEQDIRNHLRRLPSPAVAVVV